MERYHGNKLGKKISTSLSVTGKWPMLLACMLNTDDRFLFGQFAFGFIRIHCLMFSFVVRSAHFYFIRFHSLSLFISFMRCSQSYIFFHSLRCSTHIEKGRFVEWSIIVITSNLQLKSFLAYVFMSLRLCQILNKLKRENHLKSFLILLLGINTKL